MTALAPRRQIESVRLTAGDVRHEHAIVALVVLGAAVAIIGAANIAGFIVGRFF